MSTTDSPSAAWQPIAGCLRAELADYGGLLALFEEQQKLIFAHQAGEVLRLAAAIELAARAVHDSRRRREEVVAAFAAAHARPATATLRSLLPLVDAAARPLLEALIDEVNHLLHRVRRAGRHNHSLLGRTVELHQETLRLARPDAFTQTYAPNGRMTTGTLPASAALLAAG